MNNAIYYNSLMFERNIQVSGDIIENNLRNVIHLCNEMLEHADYGDRFRKDVGCGVVYGTMRDAAYKIRQLAEDELKRHCGKSKGLHKKRDKGFSEKK